MKSLLSNSLFYPGGRIDGEPIRWACSHMHTGNFVYADDNITLPEIYDAIFTIKSYRLEGVLRLNYGSFMRLNDEDDQFEDMTHLIHKPTEEGFIVSFLFTRRKGCESAGMPQMRIMYICADAAAAYFYFYCRHMTRPKYICITNTPFQGESCNLHQVVKRNPYGLPDYLIHGGYDYADNQISPWSTHPILHRNYMDKNRNVRWNFGLSDRSKFNFAVSRTA